MIFFCFGDSITSDECTGTGSLVGRMLNADVIRNYAHGNATSSDWFTGDERITKTNVDLPPDCWFPDNTLYNQVVKALSDTAPCGEELEWKYADGAETFSVSGVTGAGISKDPDVIYIAIGTNDGRAPENRFFDDCETVVKQKYSELTRRGLASSLRWAIETLQCVYPACLIFVATPLKSDLGPYRDCEWLGDSSAFSAEVQDKKAGIIREIAGYCACPVVDTYMRSGVSRQMIRKFGDQIGIHPDDFLKNKIAKFVAGEIRALL